MVYITILDYITVTKNLIGYNNLVDYKNLANYTSLIIQKVAIEAMIILVAWEIAA